MMFSLLISLTSLYCLIQGYLKESLIHFFTFFTVWCKKSFGALTLINFISSYRASGSVVARVTDTSILCTKENDVKHLSFLYLNRKFHIIGNSHI